MQIEKILKLVKLLYEYPILTSEQISTNIDISIRSVYRYVDCLIVGGIPVESKRGSGGGLYLSEEYKRKIYNKLGGLLLAYGN